MRAINDQEFGKFQRFIFDTAGISLAASKQALVSGRLGKRLAAYRLETFGAYFELLCSGLHPQEVQTAVDLLTTNETYFFREPGHFDLLRQQALGARARSEAFRVWSAASSTGEEAYSMAMVLADCLGDQAWDVLGTDISSRVLMGAVRALYPMERARHMPQAYLRRFCLRGHGEHEGKLLVQHSLRQRVSFRQVNLNAALPELGRFDLIFLRNVMIYFNDDTKRRVVTRVISNLKPGGYLCVGHSESLSNISGDVSAVMPSVYCKTA